MNYYFFSTLCKDYESQAHCDIHIAYGLADGFQKLGKNATVLWGGSETVINGVKHEYWESVELGENDCIVYYSGMLGDRIFDCNLSNAGLKIWYPSYTTGYIGDFWDYIIIDNSHYLEQVQKTCPFTKVVWNMFGSPHVIELQNNPYIGKQKNIFYAGRLMETGKNSHVRTFANLIDNLPENYHLWIASACVWLPPDCKNGELAGRVAYSPIGLKVDPHSSDAIYNYAYLEKNEFIREVNEYFSNDRIHFLGPMAYGSFDGYIQHADCVVDFGFEFNVPGPNCKIMEPLRYGVPIVADGISFSFPLIEEFGDGFIVGYRDIEAMSQAILAIPEIDMRRRYMLGDNFKKYHSWRSRAKDLLEKIGV